MRNYFKTRRTADIDTFLSNEFQRVNSVLIYKKPHHDEVRVYRSCTRHANCVAKKCNCVALKLTLIKQGLFDLDAVLAHEMLTHRLRRTQAAAHFNKVLGHVKDKNSDRVAVASYYETLYYKDCPTLDDVIRTKKISALEWKAITFQFIAAFAKAQQRLPGFCHNDTHTKNLLLVPNTSDHVCYAFSAKRRRLALKSPFLLLAIDFDLMTIGNEEAFYGYGSEAGRTFFRYTPGNTMIDFFRFASSLRHGFLLLSEKTPRFFQEWKSFVLRYLPESFLMEGPQKNISLHIDPNGGIPSASGGALLQDLYGPGKPSALLKMLDDSYFNDLVV